MFLSSLTVHRCGFLFYLSCLQFEFLGYVLQIWKILFISPYVFFCCSLSSFYGFQLHVLFISCHSVRLLFLILLPLYFSLDSLSPCPQVNCSLFWQGPACFYTYLVNFLSKNVFFSCRVFISLPFFSQHLFTHC